MSARARSIALAAAVAAAAGACGEGGGTDRPDARDDGFDRAALLRRVGADLLRPVYERFDGAAAALATSIDAWCAALGTAGADAARDGARAAWRDAIDVWQEAEAVLIGPAAMDNKSIRERVYDWPRTSTCGIDQDVVVWRRDPQGFDPATRLPGRRSLAAIEYLLFNPTLAHSCPGPAAPPGWDALSDAERLAARCGHAAALAADVRAQAGVALAGWRPDGGDYAGALVRTTPLQAAVNVVSDAFFYVDTMVKDMKLGESAGIVVNACGTIQEPCLLEVEHRFADHGVAALRANARTLRAAFTGTIDGEEGVGFDDFLIAVGADDVAARMIGKLDALIAALDAIDGGMVGALADDYADVVAAHAAAKAFTDDLKSQFLTVLGLDIPDDVATDND